jgi:ABC-type glycerol-3-phosphate transport system permease component
MFQRRTAAGTALLYGGLLLGTGFMVSPILWMVLVSLKTEAETVAYPMTWLPEHPTLQNFTDVWLNRHFVRNVLNSTLVALVSTVLAMSFAAPAAYGFSRFAYRGGGALKSFFLTTQMVPGILLVIPYFTVMRALGLVNTYPSLFLIFTALALPFCTWMLIGFFASIPRELDEAACMDGCSRYGVFLRVILPLSAPGLAATALFAFIAAWKEYLFALVLATDSSMFTVTVAIAGLFAETRTPWNYVMAAAVITTIPALVFYVFLERYMVKGLTAGAVKG